MSLLANIIGFSAFGFGARCFQLGIQKRPMFYRPEGHVAAAAFFGAVGYWLYDVEQRQDAMIADKKKVLQATRERENAAAAAAAA